MESETHSTTVRQLYELMHSLRETKRQGIERVHGFFVVGCPDETKEDVAESFRYDQIAQQSLRRRTLTRALELPVRQLDLEARSF